MILRIHYDETNRKYLNEHYRQCSAFQWDFYKSWQHCWIRETMLHRDPLNGVFFLKMATLLDNHKNIHHILNLSILKKKNTYYEICLTEHKVFYTFFIIGTTAHNNTKWNKKLFSFFQLRSHFKCSAFMKKSWTRVPECTVARISMNGLIFF